MKALRQMENSETSNDSIDATITLVHGTFAPKATWIEESSYLGKCLRDAFGRRIAIYPFRWSGGNDHSDRQQAALCLTEKLKQCQKKHPDAKHFVIAHSHAGNIAFYAARDESIRKKLAGIVTLATPFIIARRRNLGMAVEQADLAFFVGVLTYLSFAGFGLLLDMTRSQIWAALSMILIFGSLTMLLGILYEKWRQWVWRLNEDLVLPELPAEKVLIIRSVADEASLLISFFGFLSLLTTRFVNRIGQLTVGYVELWARLAPNALRGILVYLGILLFAVLAMPLFRYLGLDEALATRLGIVILILLIYPFVIPVAVLISRNPQVVPFLISIPAGFFVAPVVLILTAALLPLGRRTAAANLALDVSVEGAPIGRYEVITVLPEAATDEKRTLDLLHCVLYEDRRVSKLIVDFITAHIYSGQHRSPMT
jgi:hypothetical protein